MHPKQLQTPQSIGLEHCCAVQTSWEMQQQQQQAMPGFVAFPPPDTLPHSMNWSGIPTQAMPGPGASLRLFTLCSKVVAFPWPWLLSLQLQ